MRDNSVRYMTPTEFNKMVNAAASSFAGVTDLNNYPEWNNLPLTVAQAAYARMTGTAFATPRTVNATPNLAGQPGAELFPVDLETGEDYNSDPYQSLNLDVYKKKAMDYIEGADLDDEFKSQLKSIIAGYDYDKEVNVENILAEYNKLASKTINPEYQARTEAAINELTAARNFLQAERETQLETERLQAGENIRQVKGDLESSGLTFSGKAIQELGDKSAYPQFMGGTLPAQPNANGMFYEGKVNQLNRLMAQGSDTAFRQSIDTLGRTAEDQLGARASTLNLPGYAYTPGIRGSIEKEKNQTLGATLSRLAEQEALNAAARKPVLNNEQLNQL
jgi:hypothetical protein